MTNINLREALREYCKSALAFLKAKITGPEDLPTGVKEKFEFSEDGSFAHSYAPEVLWYMLISQTEQILSKKPLTK